MSVNLLDNVEKSRLKKVSVEDIKEPEQTDNKPPKRTNEEIRKLLYGKG